MRLLVDANVLSEATKSAPAPAILEWLQSNQNNLVINPIILGEIRFGILRLPSGHKRKKLEDWFARGVARLQCLPWTAATGLTWAALIADLRNSGKAMPIKDSQIAATALQHGLTVVTRNVRDFEAAGVRLLNPFGA